MKDSTNKEPEEALKDLDYEVIIIYYLLSKRRKERIEKFLKEK